MFEYLCRDCGRNFEAFVTAERTPACPACQGDNLAKLLSSPGMVGGSSRSEPSFPAGSCGAGGEGCACRMNSLT
jgi:putative FmdB family regulatory protein